MLFDFDHYYDPELTPRRKYTQKIVILDSQLEEEKAKLNKIKVEHAQIKTDLEKEILSLSSKF